MFNSRLRWMISNTSCMAMCNGILSLSTSKIMVYQGIIQADTNNSWPTPKLDSHLVGVVVRAHDLNHHQLRTFLSSYNPINHDNKHYVSI